MDPSIMKLLEEDEDESMHSGADIEALQAALNRDIGGGAEEAGGNAENAAVPQIQPSDSASGSSKNSSQSFLQWQTSEQNGRPGSQSQEDLKSKQKSEQNSSQELNTHGSDPVNQQQQSNILHLLQPEQSQVNLQQSQAEPMALHVTRTAAMQAPQQNSSAACEVERKQDPDGESQYIKLQRMSDQQAMNSEQTNNAMNRSKQIPFARLFPVIMPQLDKDRAMQLQTIYTRLKRNEIPKEAFIRHMRSLVGDQMLKMAVMKLQSQSGPSKSHSQSQSTTQQQHGRTPPVGSASSTLQLEKVSTCSSMENNVTITPEVEHQSNTHGIQGQMSSAISGAVNKDKEHSAVTLQGHSRQEQQFQYPQATFPMDAGSNVNNYCSYSWENANTLTSTLRHQPHDSQMRQMPVHHNMGSTQHVGAMQAIKSVNVSKFEKQNPTADPKRMQRGSQNQISNSSKFQQNPVPWQATNKGQQSGTVSLVNPAKQELVDWSCEQEGKPPLSTPEALPSFSAMHVDRGNTVPGTLTNESLEKKPYKVGLASSPSMTTSSSVSSSMRGELDPKTQVGSRIPSASSYFGISESAKATPEKPFIGLKKPIEVRSVFPHPYSKKQKVSGTFSDQCVDQLNDVTAVSGVNLTEEEEHLFCGKKEDRVSEETRRVVQEEEERLILLKIPVKKKLAEIMAKFDLKSFSNDVERCLSLCVEERLRSLMCNLIRMSKQRVDAEKSRHRTIITSDVGQQIMTMNRKAKQEWEKKQAEAEKLRKLDEPESSGGDGGEKEKDEVRAKSQKASKEEDDKMRTTAANVAARAAVGGDDLLSKWQLMAQQSKQKRGVGTYVASGSHTGKDPLLTSGRNIRAHQEKEKRNHASPISVSRGNRKSGVNQISMPQSAVAQAVSLKDVVAVLEREPQMSKSDFIYRLYRKIRSDALVE